MRAPLTVLMYHAIGAQRGDAAADPHYTVAAEAFASQLAMLREAGLRASSVTALLDAPHPRAVALTFDDGHASNAAAAERIARAGGSADFFVNPATVGRQGFLDWAALSEMASQGHAIQSHGHTHRYFDEMDEATVEEELRASKGTIEDRLGRPVSVFAPPGGRLTARVAPIAARLGFRAICCSRAGLWAGTSPWAIPRLAVLAATGMPQFERWIAQDRWEIARMRLRHEALDGAKRLLGNRGYERLRARLLGAPRA